MTIVPQYNKFSCVTACIESFLRDLGRDFDHKKFVEANLDLFCGGTPEEGCCDISALPEICKRIGISSSPVNGQIHLNGPNETLMLSVFWMNDPGQKHFVRLAGKNEDALLVMNPGKADSLDAIPERWIRGIFKISV